MSNRKAINLLLWFTCPCIVHRQETEASDCGEYFCEVTCIDNPGVKSENSKLARIELAADNGEGKPLAIGSSYAQKTQTQGNDMRTFSLYIHTLL